MMNRLIFFLCILLPVAAQAGDGKAKLFTKHNSGFNCERILSPDVEVINSGKISEETMQDLTHAVDEIFGQEGILKKLGISSPPQTIEFMSGADLGLISTLNRYPVGHWHDGGVLARRSLSGAIYEIVIPGKTRRHSLYRDDNRFAHNVSILMHVAGHTHFGVHNRFRQTRAADLVQDAYDLDAYLDEIKQTVNPDEVNRFYQYLLSLVWQQDMINATSEDDVDNYKAKPGKDSSRLRVKRTPNVLQTYIANFPKEWPEWKHNLARRFEKLQRYISGAIRTKIMNEGFATILMEILPKYSSYRSFTFGMEYCCLLSGVARPNISNPYWLGVEAYRHLYERFKKGHYTEAFLRQHGFGTVEPQIDVKGLSELEVDRAYVEWVTKNLIETMDDAEFLDFTFRDGEWLAKQNLAVVRSAKDYNEFDPNLPPPPDPEMNWQWLIQSRDPAEVIKAIIAEVKGFEYQFPNVEITDINENQSGIIKLELSDRVGRNVPLKEKTMVETLLVHARLNERPVALESSMEVVTYEEVPQDVFFNRWGPPNIDRNRETEYRLDEKTGEYKLYYVNRGLQRVKTVVYPDGKVEVFTVLRDGNSSPESLPTSLLFPEQKKIELVRQPELEEKFKKFTLAFIENVNLDDVQDEVQLGGQSFRKSTLSRIEDKILSATAGPSVDMQMAVPTAGKAIHEYDSYVKKRMRKALERAMKNPGGVVIKGQRITVKTLPDIPSFGFDQKIMKRFMASQELAPAHQGNDSTNGLTFMRIFKTENLKRVIPIPGKTGDRKWGPNPNGKNGDGDGDGDEDGDPSDEPGDQPGEGGIDPTYVDISLDDWARALEDVVELPNLRPKGDKSKTTSEEKGGKVYKRHGQPVVREIIRKAYKRGLTQSIIDEDEDDQTVPDIIRRGLATMTEKDWVVRGWNPVREPEINAQVTLIMDLSGSMDRLVPIAKRIFFDFRAILMRRYKKITFRFISFDGQAHVFETFEEFMRARLGGGTSYHVALEKDLEVKKQFPPEKYDRFTALIGDMEDFGGPEFEEALKKVIAESQFVAAFGLNDRDMEWGLGAILKRLHEEEPYFGYAEVIPPDSYTPAVFRRAFKNPEKQ